MTRTVVGIVRGGTSSEADLSLKTGAALLAAFPEEEYDVRDIFIDKEGLWYTRGLSATPAHILGGLDVAVNALHGGIGEDGTLSRLAGRVGTPLTGSPAHASAASLNKARARELLAASGIKMPRGVAFRLSDGTSADVGVMTQYVFSQFGPPYILKPISDGGSEGVMLAKTILELADALTAMLATYRGAIVEEYVRGEEATVGVIADYRDESLYALPPAMIGAPEGYAFLPKDVLRSGLDVRVPAPGFTRETKRELERIARFAHAVLGLEHYSRADFIVAPSGIYLLEVNALPGLYEGAAFPTILNAVGDYVPRLAQQVVSHELSRAR
jgi:D-alanine--D-alanine ligase